VNDTIIIVTKDDVEDLLDVVAQKSME